MLFRSQRHAEPLHVFGEGIGAEGPPLRTILRPVGRRARGQKQRGARHVGLRLRMHHKFVVIDFDTEDARVFFGSYNFSEPADFDNGENLLMIKDRTVATSFMIEALRIYDHYRFRAAREDAKAKGVKSLELALPPKSKSGRPWWRKDWDDPIRKRDRELFA